MGNVEWFLHENPDFVLASVKEHLCEELQSSVIRDGCLQLLPGVHKSDGFFIAKFKRVSHE
jgi:16S rRNA (cytosine967-C5)-methyltransferase